MGMPVSDAAAEDGTVTIGGLTQRAEGSTRPKANEQPDKDSPVFAQTNQHLSISACAVRRLPRPLRDSEPPL